YVLALRHADRRPKLFDDLKTALAIADGLTVIDKPPRLLVELGVQLDQLEILFRELERYRIISESNKNDWTRSVDAVLTKVWARLRVIAPKDPYGYIGPAMQLNRVGKTTEALAQLDAGIHEIGTTPEFLEKKADLLYRVDPQAALKLLDDE